MKIPSSFRHYQLVDLKNICGIFSEGVIDLLSPIQPQAPSELLEKILEKHLQIPMKNEKAKSELIVMPILVDVWDKNKNFKPLSGFTFNVDASKGLKGICDFIISAKPNTIDLEAPVVCIFEAKDDNIENWYGQCGAEMYAARLFNEKEGNALSIIHGAITNGFTWQFLKLENQTLYIDNQRYSIANLPKLLGAIQKVYDFYKK
jgi:hypothetical protein